MPGLSFPPLFTPILGGKKDFHTQPVFGTVCPAINVLKPPLDNVLLRYALAMGTEKKPITDCLGAGRVPTSSLVPPMPGYRVPGSLHVAIGGNSYDILSFNIEGARALLAKAGLNEIDITYNLPLLPDTKLKAEILQQQWRRNLGIRMHLVVREFSVHWKMVLDGDYSGIADFAFLPTYFDPNPFLDPFITQGAGNPAGWTDPGYSSMLARANSTLNPQERMAKLADCEMGLLRAMPVLPHYVDVLTYLQKPFVRGLTSNLFDMRAFKYARIDSNWRAR